MVVKWKYDTWHLRDGSIFTRRKIFYLNLHTTHNWIWWWWRFIPYIYIYSPSQSPATWISFSISKIWHKGAPIGCFAARLLPSSQKTLWLLTNEPFVLIRNVASLSHDRFFFASFVIVVLFFCSSLSSSSSSSSTLSYCCCCCCTIFSCFSSYTFKYMCVPLKSYDKMWDSNRKRGEE